MKPLTNEEIEQLLVGTKYEGASKGDWKFIPEVIKGNSGYTPSIDKYSQVYIPESFNTEADDSDDTLVFHSEVNARLCADAKSNAARVVQLTKLCRELVGNLTKLSNIADMYCQDRLDEARPSWGDDDKDANQIELFTGRGGTRLLTLQDALDARQSIANTIDIIGE